MMPTSAKALVLVSRFFPPQRSVGGYRIQHMAEFFAGRGWQVSVVTARDRRADPAAHRAVQEAMPGVRIRYTNSPRNPIPRSSPRPGVEQARGDGTATSTRRFAGWVKSVRDLLVFPDDANLWIPAAFVAARREAKGDRHVFVLTSAPPFSAHVAGLLLKRSAGGRITWIADFRDPYLYPERDYSRRFVDRWHRRLFGRILRGADYVLGTTDGILGTFDLGGLATDRQGIRVPNGVPRGLFDGVTPETLAAGKVVFAHLGDLDYDHRNPGPLLQAFGDLARAGHLRADQFELHFFGEQGQWGSASVTSMADAYGCASSVFLHAHVAHQRALAIMKGADVLVLLAENQPLSIPAKTYEYLASGRPVLVFTEAGSATHGLLQGLPGVCIVTARRPDEVKAGVLRLMRPGADAGVAPSAGEGAALTIESHLARLEAHLLAGAAERGAADRLGHIAPDR